MTTLISGQPAGDWRDHPSTSSTTTSNGNTLTYTFPSDTTPSWGVTSTGGIANINNITTPNVSGYFIQEPNISWNFSINDLANKFTNKIHTDDPSGMEAIDIAYKLGYFASNGIIVVADTTRKELFQKSEHFTEEIPVLTIEELLENERFKEFYLLGEKVELIAVGELISADWKYPDNPKFLEILDLYPNIITKYQIL